VEGGGKRWQTKDRRGKPESHEKKYLKKLGELTETKGGGRKGIRPLNQEGLTTINGQHNKGQEHGTDTAVKKCNRLNAGVLGARRIFRFFGWAFWQEKGEVKEQSKGKGDSFAGYSKRWRRWAYEMGKGNRTHRQIDEANNVILGGA